MNCKTRMILLRAIVGPARALPTALLVILGSSAAAAQERTPTVPLSVTDDRGAETLTLSLGPVPLPAGHGA